MWMCAIGGFRNPKHPSLEFCLSRADDGGNASFIPSLFPIMLQALCLSKFFLSIS
jgi:hypothetical protein